MSGYGSFPVVTLRLTQIERAPDNVYQHEEDDIVRLESVIRQHGFLQPIVVDADSMRIINDEARYVLVGGEARTEGARRAGLSEIPAVLARFPSVHAKRAAAIALNARFGQFDEVALEEQLISLQLASYDIEFTGLSDVDFAGMAPDDDENHGYGGADGQTDEDDAPELPDVPITQLGDLIHLGRHRLLCGDSTKSEDVNRLLDGHDASLVFTDPPYNADYSSRMDPQRPKPWGGILNDDQSAEAFAAFMEVSMRQLQRVMPTGASIYLWTDWKQYPLIATMFRSMFTQKSTIVWDKTHFGLGQYYRTQHEWLLFGCKGDRLGTWNAGSDERDVWSVSRDSVTTYKHPTQKPVELAARAMRNSSERDDVVLDLFAGSGSTVIAAEETRRVCYAMELSPRYCDVIVERWQQFTGLRAMRHAVAGKA